MCLSSSLFSRRQVSDIMSAIESFLFKNLVLPNQLCDLRGKSFKIA